MSRAKEFEGFWLMIGHELAGLEVYVSTPSLLNATITFDTDFDADVYVLAEQCRRAEGIPGSLVAVDR